MDQKEQFLAAATRSIIEADESRAQEVAAAALAAGIDPVELLEEGFVPGIVHVGNLFEAEEIFLPELMMAAEVMKAAAEICNQAMPAGGGRQRGKVVLGTVAGDIHDIGKNIVASFLTASGFEVHDLGRDVPVQRFIDAALEVEADVIASSALLTTTMTVQRQLEEELRERGLRQRFKTMVGGAPVDQKWADSIGADGYAEDAAGAAHKLKELLGLSS